MIFRRSIIVALLCIGTAHAGDVDGSLAQRHVCMACHQVDAKRVGPSFRDIALRYAGNEAAAQYLAEVIRDGSRGRWGAIPMPAQRHVDAAAALQLGEWILSLAPAVPGEDSAKEGGVETDATKETEAGMEQGEGGQSQTGGS